MKHFAFYKKNRKMNIDFNIVFNIFFLLSFSLHSQNKKLDLKDLSFSYNKVIEFSHKNDDSLIFYAKKLQLSEDLCMKIKGFLHEARGYYQKNSLNKSEKLVMYAL